MENKYNNIDEIFKNSLENFSADPPSYVWDNIDSALDKMDGKRKSRFMWLLGSFLAITTAFVGGYYLSGYLSEGNTQITESRTVIQNHNGSPLVVADQNDQHTIHLLENVKNRVVNSSTVSGTTDFTQSGVNMTTTTPTTVYNRTNNHRKANVIRKGDAQIHELTVNDVMIPAKTKENPNPKFGQNNKNIRDNGYFSPGSNKYEDNGLNRNGVAPSEEPSDDIKKNSGDHGELFNSKSIIVEPGLFQMNDHDKEEVLDELNKDNDNTVVQNQPNGLPLTGKEKKNSRFNTLSEEDAYLMPDYPVVTVMPYFAPMYTLQNSSNDDDKYSPVFSSKQNFEEKPAFSYSAGLLLGYSFTKRLTVFVGCAYNQFSTVTSRANFQTEPINQWGADTSGSIYTSAGQLSGVDYVIPTSQQAAPYLMPESGMTSPITRITQSFGFIEVPVLVRYRLFGPKVSMTLTGGLSTGFLVRNDVIAENDRESIVAGKTENMRNFNVNANFGVGLEAKILPWLYFNFEPTVRYSFLNWSTDSQVKMNPVFFSANTGFSFKF